MHRLKTAVAGVALAACLLAGCGKVNGAANALTINGDDISLGTASFEMRYQQAQIAYMMQMYGLSSGDELWNSDAGEDEDGNAQTYGESTKTSIKDSIVEQVVMRQHAADYDVEIPEEIAGAITEAAQKAFADNESAFSKIGVSEDNIREALELSAYSALMREPMTADVDTEVSDEEAAQSTITYARVQIADDSSDEEEKTALMQEFLDALLAEEDPAAADMKALGTEKGEDIFVTDYSYGSDNVYLAEEVITAAATLKDGEVYDKLITTGDGYVYAVRMDKVFDEEATESEKTQIVQERKNTAYNDLVQEWRDSAEVTTTEAWESLTITDSDQWTVAAE